MLKYQMFLKKRVQLQRIAGRTGFLMILAGVAVVGLSASPAMGDECSPPRAADRGDGTVDLPEPSSRYEAVQDYHKQVAAGTDSWWLRIIHWLFRNLVVTSGGTLGGQIETFDSSLQLTIEGVGGLAGFNRAIYFDTVQCVVHSAARTPGDAVQTFATTMHSLEGSIAAGDPDFATLTITAGDAFGMASPGQTTLTRLGDPGSDFQVDSSFEISFRVDWVGAAGGALDGLSGTETGTVTMEACLGAIPAVSDWGVVAMVLLVLAVGTVVIRRSRRLAA